MCLEDTVGYELLTGHYVCLEGNRGHGGGGGGFVKKLLFYD